MGFTIKGYGHPLYSESLGEFGIPCELPQSGGYYLQRPIPGTQFNDGMGAYPLFTCERWEYLARDFEEIGFGIVSFFAVLDPFSDLGEDALHRCFPDMVLPFKKHFIIDFRRPLAISDHHLRNARNAVAKVHVEFSDTPLVWLHDWITLYDQLIQRHQIGDIRRFSPCAFAWQFKIPGMFALRAVYEGATVGMLLFLAQNDTLYYHLGAYSPQGYRLKASFALFSAAIDQFRGGFERINLGAGAGLISSTEDGLSRFKAGWSNETRITHFCGRILNRPAYDQICREKNIAATSYFPAYRQGEFCKKQPIKD